MEPVDGASRQSQLMEPADGAGGWSQLTGPVDGPSRWGQWTEPADRASGRSQPMEPVDGGLYNNYVADGNMFWTLENGNMNFAPTVQYTKATMRKVKTFEKQASYWSGKEQS